MRCGVDQGRFCREDHKAYEDQGGCVVNASDLDPFLLAGTLICAAMAVVSALRHKKRGISAYIMSAAFLVLGFDMLLVRMRASQYLVILGCIFLVLLLVADF